MVRQSQNIPVSLLNSKILSDFMHRDVEQDEKLSLFKTKIENPE